MRQKEVNIVKKTKNFPTEVRLDYDKGDLIIKEGDFGISIYKIISGQVEIFVKSNGRDVKVATQGPGMIIGGMALLTSDYSPRVASARAVEDSILEVWHPAMIKSAFKKMPNIFKFIVGQALKNLIRLNKMASAFSLEKEIDEDDKTQESSDEWWAERKFYRKKVNLECEYVPIDSPEEIKLKGQIKDISKGGVLLEINALNSVEYPHLPGNKFRLSTYLKRDVELKVTSQIVNINEGEKDRMLCLGMAFKSISHENEKRLGFFLMP